MSAPPARMVVRGGAETEEIAALVAVLSACAPSEGDDRYRRWRRARADALRRSSERPCEVFARR